MKITKENYETWMLSYVEGELKGKELAEFEDFLLHHPELQSEAKELNTARLSEGETFFPDQNLLKAKMLKQVIEEEEMTCFEAAEGTLDPEKRLRLDKRLQSSERIAEKLSLYTEARLSADDSVVFPYKSLLNRSAIIAKGKPLLWWPYAAAAAMLAFIVYMVLPMGPGRISVAPVAQKSETTKEAADTTGPAKPKEVIQNNSPSNLSSSPKELSGSPAKEKEKTPTIQKATPGVKMPSTTELLAQAKAKKQATKATGIESVELNSTAEEIIAQVKELRTDAGNKGNDSKEPKTSNLPVIQSLVDTKNRRQIGGRANPNFVKMQSVPDYEASPYDPAESLVAKVATYVGGERIKISEGASGGTRVTLNTKLLGFSATLK